MQIKIKTILIFDIKHQNQVDLGEINFGNHNVFELNLGRGWFHPKEFGNAGATAKLRQHQNHQKTLNPRSRQNEMSLKTRSRPISFKNCGNLGPLSREIKQR